MTEKEEMIKRDIDELLDKNEVAKDKFRRVISLLFSGCFILKDKKETKEDFRYIINNEPFCRVFLEMIDYELRVNKELGVISVRHIVDKGRMSLTQAESMLLIFLRLLYIEWHNKVSLGDRAVVCVGDLQDRYKEIKGKSLTKEKLRAYLGNFKRLNIIDASDDLGNPETEVIIYPSVTFAIDNEELDSIYEQSQNRLDGYLRKDEKNNEED